MTCPAWPARLAPSPLCSPHPLAARSLHLGWFQLQFQPPVTQEEWPHSGCLLSNPGSSQPSRTRGTEA